jgi:hypothetical protein
MNTTASCAATNSSSFVPTGNLSNTPVIVQINPEKSKKSSDSSEACVALCGGCGICIFALGIAAAAIVYIVHAIIALSNDKNISDECSLSHVWAYILTHLIVEFLVKANAGKNASSKDDITNMIVIVAWSGLIDLGLSIWGTVELFYLIQHYEETNITNNTLTNYTITDLTDPMVVACEDLQQSSLWTMGYITLGIELALLGISFIILIICICMCICCHKM